MERFDERVLDTFSKARLHFGLQNDEGWDHEIIQQRYPAQSWRILQVTSCKLQATQVTS